MFTNGDIFIGCEMNVALSTLNNQRSIVLAMTDKGDEILKYNGVYLCSSLLPPPSCLEVAEVYPDNFKQAYMDYLASSEEYGPLQDIITILMLLRKGFHVFIYYDGLDNDNYGFAEIFCEFMATAFGIFIGTQTTECMYNSAFDYHNLLFMYCNDLVSAREVLFKIKSPVIDPNICARLCNDLGIVIANNDPVTSFNNMWRNMSGKTPWHIKGET